MNLIEIFPKEKQAHAKDSSYIHLDQGWQTFPLKGQVVYLQATYGFLCKFFSLFEEQSFKNVRTSLSSKNLPTSDLD